MNRYWREARLWLVAIPVLLWTLLPIYHIFLFSISTKDSAFSGALWPDHPTLRNFGTVFRQEHFYLHHFWEQIWNSLWIAVAVGVLTLFIATCAAFAISRIKVPGGLPRRADVQGDGHLWAAEQPLVAGARHGDARLALRDLGAEAGLRQAAVGARRGGAHRRRDAAAAFPLGVPAADDAVARRDRHLRAPPRVERIPLRILAAVA